jgi:glyoxylase-like metal-dependent hydrolase (beta-lactamase superfamily II)
MRELQTGLWWWEATHPEWKDEDAATEDWGPAVSSYAIDDGELLLLVDPVTPPEPVDRLTAERETAVVLTCPWHERDTWTIAERLGARVFAPPPDGPTRKPPTTVFQPGEHLPFGIEAFPGLEPPYDLLLWVESRRVLLAGDTLIDRGRGLEFPRDWANKGVPADEILDSLRPLLELPIELVLPTHGPPADRAALERALA